MKLLDILEGAWAIMPSKLVEIRGIYDTHLRGPKIDVKEIEARIGQPLQRKDQGYSVTEGVAIVPVDGVIAKKMNLFHEISGGASTELIKRDIEAALDDPLVNSIILDIDSPGGSVDGTQELAQFIYASRGEKPLIAVANGTMASAAYWIGAACDAVYASAGTTAVGSIGVVAQHVDTSKRDAEDGVKRTEIYAGKYKRIASQHEPLSDEGRADIQAKVDYLYSVFVADIATFRGTSVDAVLENMADGRIFIGAQALEAGLVDGVATLDEVIGKLASGDLPISTKINGKENAMTGKATETPAFTLESLTASHPDLVEAIRQGGYEAGHKDGIAAETARVKAVKAASLPGHEALIEQFMFDGKTNGGDAAAAVIAAERNRSTAALAAMQNDAAELNNVPAAEAADAPTVDLTTEEGRKAVWDAKGPACEGFHNFAAMNAYYKNIGNHRVFSKKEK